MSGNFYQENSIYEYTAQYYRLNIMIIIIIERLHNPSAQIYNQMLKIASQCNIYKL